MPQQDEAPPLPAALAVGAEVEAEPVAVVLLRPRRQSVGTLK
jgi:hypothetical protein